MSIPACLLVSAALFSLGIAGVLTRRSAIGILIAIELMTNAVNINFVAFARLWGGLTGQAFALFSLALTVAEVVVGLAIVLLLFRTHKNVLTDSAVEMKG
jgi:NADH:ubiquinone oxidoreductase subunit K